MIAFNHISKSFAGKQILRDISGSFEKGKVSMIIGTSGTGKSVLLKCLVGLIKPDNGDVLFDGRDLITCESDVRKDIRREIGMLFQGGALFDSKTVEKNVQFPLDMMTQMSHSEKEERVYNSLKRVGLEAAAKKMPSEISGGMKKRVGIARAIVLNPKYLFVDEPNSGLDPQTSITIDELLHEITIEYNTTTVIVSHDMNSLMGIGEHIIFLHQGQKEWEGKKEDLMTAHNKALDDFVFAGKAMESMRKLYQSS